MTPGIQLSIFRRGRKGSARTSSTWLIRIRLPDGRRIERKGYSDRRATEQLAAKLVRDIERDEAGLDDKMRQWRAVPLRQHLDDFLTAMEAGSLGRRRRGGRPTEAYVARCRARLERLLRDLPAAWLGDLEQAKADEWLAARSREDLADKTRDDHADLLRQFGAWLVDAGRLKANPYRRLRRVRTAASRTFHRRALTPEDLGALCSVAVTRPLQEFARAQRGKRVSEARSAELVHGGYARAIAYLLAAYSGLRRGEVCAIEWRDLDLVDADPAVSVRAEISKNRRAARIPIPRWLAGELQGWRRRAGEASGRVLGPRDRVCPISYRHCLERMQEDLLAAKLGTRGARRRVVDPEGLVLDFHCLRATYATYLAESGVPQRQALDLMRHTDIRLTMEVYAKVQQGSLRASVDRLPRPVAGEPPPAPLQTGHDTAQRGTARHAADDRERKAT